MIPRVLTQFKFNRCSATSANSIHKKYEVLGINPHKDSQACSLLAAYYSSLLIRKYDPSTFPSSSSIRFSKLTKPSTQHMVIMPKRHYGAETFGVISTIQDSLQSLHQSTNLPWWETIALSTIGVRMALFPLVRYQMLASRKLAGAIPEINFLFQLLRNRVSHIPIQNMEEQKKVFSVFFKGVSACLTLHQVRLIEILFYPILNFAVFVSFVYGVRDMVIHAPIDYDLDLGGIGWFVDLTDKDRTFILPLSALGLSYAALEVTLYQSKGKFILFIKDFVQSILILSIPVITNLPSGVFCYWIPNGLFSIGQSLLMKNRQFQEIMRIPPPVSKR